jgi:hypothetical protein
MPKVIPPTVLTGGSEEGGAVGRGVLTKNIIMKIQLPIINIESDEYEYAISALMSWHGMPRAGAKAYLVKIMTDEAKMSVRNIVSEYK